MLNYMPCIFEGLGDDLNSNFWDFIVPPLVNYRMVNMDIFNDSSKFESYLLSYMKDTKLEILYVNKVRMYANGISFHQMLLFC